MLHPSSHRSKLRRVAVCLISFASLVLLAPVITVSQNERQTTAEMFFEEAERLLRQDDASSLRAAIQKYEHAAQRWSAVGAQPSEAKALLRIAVAYFRLEELPEAVDHYERALKLGLILEDYTIQAQALNGIGNVYAAKGENQKALDRYSRSLELHRLAGNRTGEAYTLGNIGATRWVMGEPRKALDYYEQALTIMTELGDRNGQAFPLYRIGLVNASLSENSKALEYYNRALELQRATGDHRSEASTLNNIGLVYASLGEYQKAFEYYDQALVIRRAQSYRAGEAITLHNIGNIYAKLGETEKALGYYKTALRLSEDAGDRRGYAYTLDSIGVAYWKLGDYREAVTYLNHALATFVTVGHKTGEATSLADIGLVYFGLGDTKQAMDHYEKALSLFAEIEDRPGEIRTLIKLGQMFAHSDNTAQALHSFKKGVELAQAIGDQLDEANALFEIALLDRKQGNTEKAYGLINNARRLAELLRANVAAEELRVSYIASVRNYYDLEIDLLMRLYEQQPSRGFADLALQVSESSRARSLIDTLNESQVRIKAGIDPRLLAQEENLRKRLQERSFYQSSYSGKRTDEELAAGSKEIDDLRVEYEQIKRLLKQVNPRYTALTQPEPLNAIQIRQQIVDSNTVLLEYALGSDRSFLWFVTPSSVYSFALPKRVEIESVARQVYDSLIARNSKPEGETPDQRAKRLARADRQYFELATKFSNLLLGPVVHELGTKRLLVVAEGALQYIPFAALPVPAGSRLSGRDRSFRPLIVDHEVVSLPSASTLAVLRRELAGRSPGDKTLAVLADPVFEISDPRVINQQAASGQPTKDLSSVESTQQKLPEKPIGAEADEPTQRLPFSRDEAEQILALVPASQSKSALDFDASRATALSSTLSEYRIVHFATHSIVNTANPGRSGVLLSRVTKSGEYQDGFLRLDEIYNLKLPAELVVLSGCETALGKDIRGEGMIGLTRGFMYAGSPRVVASLWKIDDRATAELMKRFYKGMLGNHRLPPAAALREAQTFILGKQNWTHPYYWAAFVIQGEWK
jgi:CHAT domain-containing protein/Tfp pilus assembly protein PilF